MATDFWKCEGCGNVIGGHFREGVKDEKTGKAIYVVECPTCGHSGYKVDADIEHNYKTAKKRWITQEEELEGMTQNQLLREHGFHEIANRHTETINPKRDIRYHSSDEDELRKKKSTKPKSKRIKKTTLEAFLPTGTKIKSMKNKAEAKIKSVYSPVTLNLRKKKSKKVVAKRKTKSGKK